MTQETRIVPRNSLVATFAQRYGVDADRLLDTLKATAFRQRANSPPITNEQMMSLLVVANEYKLNPFTREIFAYPDKQNGIVPVVSVDGWTRIINEHSQFDGEEFEEAPSNEWIIDPKGEHKPCPSWLGCAMFRKDRSRPTKVKEYLDEVYRPPFVKDNYPINGPWQSHTKRMLRHKAHIQCARLAFGFAGIFDEDEAMRILEAQDVTPIVVTATTSRTSTAKEAARIALNREPPIAVGEKPLQDTGDIGNTTDDTKKASGAPSESSGIQYPSEVAIKLLASAVNRKSITAFWDMICDDYDFNGQLIPPDIEDYYKSRRDELPEQTKNSK